MTETILLNTVNAARPLGSEAIKYSNLLGFWAGRKRRGLGERRESARDEEVVERPGGDVIDVATEKPSSEGEPVVWRSTED